MISSQSINSQSIDEEMRRRSSSFKKRELDNDGNDTDILIEKPAMGKNKDNVDEEDCAATKLQKFYKSYRTRRNLADCAVVVEELWWKALDSAALRQSSVSFFSSDKAETAISRWKRASIRTAKVGKGLCKDEKAQELALRHWLEAIDPRHRYGQNLRRYYEAWFASESTQPFFFWLDIGEGKEVNLEKCPRTDLQRQCIKYLGPKEREAYEVVVENGKLGYRQSRVAVNTSPEGSKWIFVLSTSRKLYVGEKKKGLFQHSSFLAGGATISSGRLVAHNGILEAIWPFSGHYRPTEENFMEFCSFLEDHQVDMTNVKKFPTDDDIPPIFSDKYKGLLGNKVELSAKNEEATEANGEQANNNNTTAAAFIKEEDQKTNQSSNSSNVEEEEKEEEEEEAAAAALIKEEDQKPSQSSISSNVVEEEEEEEAAALIKEEDQKPCQSSNSSNVVVVVEEEEEDAVFEFDSNNNNKPLMWSKWSTGAGARISCVRDYPTQLQIHALEHVHLSPRVKPPALATSSCINNNSNNGPVPSPRPSPKILLSPRLACMGLASSPRSSPMHGTC